jgi:hypothetical protein
LTPHLIDQVGQVSSREAHRHGGNLLNADVISKGQPTPLQVHTQDLQHESRHSSSKLVAASSIKQNT